LWKEQSITAWILKIKAVELSKHREVVKPVAKEIEIPTDNLRRWKREYDELVHKMRKKTKISWVFLTDIYYVRYII
jgi:hypothetical protein